MLETPEQNRTESGPTEGGSGTLSEETLDKSITNFGDGARGGCRTISQFQLLTTPNPPKTFH
jgi:hypothetical protein